ncbi:MAG: rhomboid family intramembrane serine protease [Spirochaetes bacterium]|nr:rhomboid family intramembrane serine protease [Spirochaetota bacterium]
MRRENSFWGSATFWILIVTVVVYFIQQHFANYLVVPNREVLTVNFKDIPSFLDFMLRKFANGVSPVNVPIDLLNYLFGMNPFAVVNNLEVWRLFSYIFLHAVDSPTHLIFNMLILFMCGFPLEEEWGKRRFIFYYFLCGIGAGIVITVMGIISNGFVPQFPTIGASGALFGILFAYARLNPNSVFLIFFIIPVRAKYFIIIYALIELFFELSGAQPGVSHIGHLGGLLTGFLYFLYMKHKFTKKRKRRMPKKRHEFSVISSEKSDNSMIMKNVIIEKLRGGKGKEALTDDEWQYIKYLDIIHDSEISDERKGIKSDKEFINEVRGYIKL